MWGALRVPEDLAGSGGDSPVLERPHSCTAVTLWPLKDGHSKRALSKSKRQEGGRLSFVTLHAPVLPLACGLRYITTPALPCACCCCSCCLHRRDERRKTKAGGERAAAGTLPLIVIVTLSVTVVVTVVVTVSAALIVPVAALATVGCPHIDNAHPKGACVDIRNPHLRRPRS